MIAAFLLFALLQVGEPAEADENSPFSDRQPVRLAPLPTAQALAVFRDVCMTGFPDPAAFDAAAAASSLGFVKRAEPQRGAQEWSSSHGHLRLSQAPRRGADLRRERREGRTPRQRWQVRCDFWVAVEEIQETPALVAIIGHQLAGDRPAFEEIIGTSWDLGADPAGGTRKLVYIPSTDDPRLFTLSLQRLADYSPR